MRKGDKVCAQIPFMQAQEVIIASPGGEFLVRSLGGALRAWHQRGMHDFEGEAGGADHISPLLTATVEKRRCQTGRHG